jgi:hypothetical protein
MHKSELIKELKLMDDGDIEPTYERIADYVLSREAAIREKHREVLERLNKDITQFAMQIKTKESQYKDGYCDGMLKACRFIEAELKGQL